ncbi:MAG: hypothetical protein RBT49_15680 [Bacteroidales bacterium]|jgi:hypothetical protein|nr:hypothetical protein [Bacteroidales bacterium]
MIKHVAIVLVSFILMFTHALFISPVSAQIVEPCPYDETIEFTDPLCEELYLQSLESSSYDQLVLINDNLVKLKAFAYALSVVITAGAFFYIYNKVFIILWGRIF